MGETEDMTSERGSEDAPVVIEDALEDEMMLDALAADLEDAAVDAAHDEHAEVTVDTFPEDEAVPDELALLAADLDSEEVAVAAPDDATQPLPDDTTPADEAVVAPGASESFDTIAPAEVAKPAEEVVAVSPSSGQSVPWWPFLAYFGAWLVLSGLAVWQLMQAPAAQATYESAIYGPMILGGVVMTAVGPVLILAVWLAVRSGRAPGERTGLFTSSLLKGALVTLGGAIVWWAAILIVDYLRLGTPL